MSTVKKLFDEIGVMIFRDALPTDIVASWRMAYDALSNPERVPEFNPVAVNDERLQPVLSLIASHPIILDAVAEIFGPDIALYNQRFVVKDKHAREPVFLHQDTPYHLGWPQKASAFVALSRVTADNGGMIFYPGTHRYGYLGDAGEINPAWLHGKSAVCPELTQGDFVLMHSALWHESRANTNGIDRVMADIHYQPANDPSGRTLMRGEWKTDIRISDEMREHMFMRSRTTRLMDLQEQLDDYKDYKKRMDEYLEETTHR